MNSTMTVVLVLAGVLAAWALTRKAVWELIGAVVLAHFLGVARKPRTDATFLRHGTAPLRAHDRPGRWHYQPRAVRVAFAWSALFAAVALPVGWSLHRDQTVNGLAAVAVATAGIGVAHAVLAAQGRAFRERYILPLAATLGPQLGVPDPTPPDEWLTIPRDYADDGGAEVQIRLPASYADSDGARDMVERTVKGKLALGDFDSQWRLVGEPVVSFRRAPRPPTRVGFDDVRDAIAAAPVSVLVLGLGARRKVVSVSTDLDSPHLALSAPSNAGKSVAAGLMVSQQLFKGALSCVLDIKAESHLWAFGLPNAVVMTRVETIHTAMVLVHDEVRRRQRVVEAMARAGHDRPAFTPIWVLAEEQNLTRRELAQYWSRYREADPARAKHLPKSSPALEAYMAVSFAGRSVEVRMIMVAQRLTAAATGDNTGAVRESMGIRYMIKPRVSTWAMLADGAALPRFVRGVKGRGHVVVEGHAEEVQGAYLTAEEMRALALGGTIAEMPGDLAAAERDALRLYVSREVESLDVPAAPGLQTLGLHIDDTAHDLRKQASALPCAAPGRPALHVVPSAPVTLREAIDEGVITGLTLPSLRAARSREGFPAPVDREGRNLVYDRAALIEWQAGRPRMTKRAR